MADRRHALCSMQHCTGPPILAVEHAPGLLQGVITYPSVALACPCLLTLLLRPAAHYTAQAAPKQGQHRPRAPAPEPITASTSTIPARPAAPASYVTSGAACQPMRSSSCPSSGRSCPSRSSTSDTAAARPCARASSASSCAGSLPCDLARPAARSSYLRPMPMQCAGCCWRRLVVAPSPPQLPCPRFHCATSPAIAPPTQPGRHTCGPCAADAPLQAAASACGSGGNGGRAAGGRRG